MCAKAYRAAKKNVAPHGFPAFPVLPQHWSPSTPPQTGRTLLIKQIGRLCGSLHCGLRSRFTRSLILRRQHQVTPRDPPTAIVTGGGSGIGREIAQQLIRYDYRVAVVDQHGETLADRCEGIDQQLALPCPADVADPAAWHQLIERLRSEWPRLDLLVNCAGVLACGELHHCQLADLQRVVAINLGGTINGCHAATPWLIESAATGRPRQRHLPRPGIINIASIFAMLAPPGFAAYNASKAGVVGLSESLRGELSPHGLNVTVSLPGATPTGLFERAEFASPTLAKSIERYLDAAELTAQQVGEQTLRAAARGRAYTVIGKRARRFAWLKRMAAEMTIRRVAERTRQQLGLPSPPDSTHDEQSRGC